jgi:hypothetical protein
MPEQVLSAFWAAVTSHANSEWAIVTGAPASLGLCVLMAAFALSYVFRILYRREAKAKDDRIDVIEERLRLAEDRHKQKDEFIERLKNVPPSTNEELKTRLEALEKELHQRWPRLDPQIGQRIAQQLLAAGIQFMTVANVSSSDSRDLAGDFGRVLEGNGIRTGGIGGLIVQSHGAFPPYQGDGLWITFGKQGESLANEAKKVLERELGFPVRLIAAPDEGSGIMLNIGHAQPRNKPLP